MLVVMILMSRSAAMMVLGVPVWALPIPMCGGGLSVGGDGSGFVDDVVSDPVVGVGFGVGGGFG